MRSRNRAPPICTASFSTWLSLMNTVTPARDSAIQAKFPTITPRAVNTALRREDRNALRRITKMSGPGTTIPAIHSPSSAAYCAEVMRAWTRWPHPRCSRRRP